MIDPIVSLAFNVYSAKGTYALLLGSGMSRAAQIPTGWEIIRDLIQKVATTEHEDASASPELWLKSKHGIDPDYSALLDMLGRTPAERQHLLAGYFEPTADEKARGIKQPTAAHRAIAQLCAGGFIRLIVTTNFDRLTEQALAEIGLTPAVISNVDQIKGAQPLVHAPLTIIKLHGDYQDSRLRNTEPELAGYEPEFERLLDRVFDEFGLIVCGWSAVWDRGLRAAIERCPSRRYTLFWSDIKEPAEAAQRIIVQRAGIDLRITDANTFFAELRDKVEALAAIGAPHPLSPKIAVATVKRYLTDPTDRIRLRDTVHAATEALVAKIGESDFPAELTGTPADLQRRVAKYDAYCETLVSMIAAGANLGTADQVKLWNATIQRIANVPCPAGASLPKLRRYPAHLLLYANGIAAIAAERYDAVAAMFDGVRVLVETGEPHPAIRLNSSEILRNDFAKWLPGGEGRATALSEHVCNVLREPLRDFLPADAAFLDTFDRWELILGMVYVDKVQRPSNGGGLIGPSGCFIWRHDRESAQWLPTVIEKEIFDKQDEWPPLKAGLFAGNVEVAVRTIQSYARHLRALVP